MTATILPMAKALYFCDEVLEDPTSLKTHMIGVFNAIRAPASATFPYRLPEFCVFAQLVGGVGEVPIHVEIVDKNSEVVIYEFPKQHLRFPTRLSIVFACFRIRNCWFTQPGVHVVELYCQDTFIDDRVLHILAEERDEP